MSVERLYYGDAFLRRFTARVTAARPAAANAAAPHWEVALDRTAFYPTSGGQPFDTGRMRMEPSGPGALDVAVTGVAEDEAGEIWHAVASDIPTGAEVEGFVDWERRLDHMQQHSGQHLLSAIFLRELQAPTVSFHLGPESSNIDLASTSLTEAALERVEDAANGIIAEDRPVTARRVERAEAEALLAAGRLRKLPERAGALRLIEIADCDLNACGGTHVRATGQIGGLWLRGVENISRGVRVHFVCGLRAVRAGRADAATLRAAGAALSVGTAGLTAALERMQAEAKASARERQQLREALADAEGAQLLSRAQAGNGWRLVAAAGGGRDRDQVRLLAARLTAAVADVVVLVTSGEPGQARLVLARGAAVKLDCAAVLKPLLGAHGARGGGSPTLAQAEVAADAAPALSAVLAARLQAQLG